MNASFIVTVTGVYAGRIPTIEKMLREEIATYPSRVSMAAATVERVVKKPPETRAAQRARIAGSLKNRVFDNAKS